MSQEDTFKILKELGGKATSLEISRRAKEKYPHRTLHHYVSTRLKDLAKWGFVIKEVGSDGKKIWKIKK